MHETESQLILNGSYNINFTMDLACKDLGFADQIADKLGIPLELGSVTRQILKGPAPCMAEMPGHPR